MHNTNLESSQPRICTEFDWNRCNVLRMRVAPRHGFEPRFTAPKAAVLPLDDRGNWRRLPLHFIMRDAADVRLCRLIGGCDLRAICCQLAAITSIPVQAVFHSSWVDDYRVHCGA